MDEWKAKQIADELLLNLRSGTMKKIGIDEVRSKLLEHGIPLTDRNEMYLLRKLISKV